MVDPERGLRLAPGGFLQVRGEGGLTTDHMRELLTVFEDAYTVAAKAELFARRELTVVRAAQRWARRWGPPELMLPFASYGLARSVPLEALPGPSRPLVVSRVRLASPGFWEFAGALNPLEVLRQYLNDRHERRKDRAYRSNAEAEQMALENAARRLGVLRQYMELQREFADELGVIEGMHDQIAGAIRPALERLGDVDDRGLIDGESARTSEDPSEAMEM